MPDIPSAAAANEPITASRLNDFRAILTGTLYTPGTSFWNGLRISQATTSGPTLTLRCPPDGEALRCRNAADTADTLYAGGSYRQVITRVKFAATGGRVTRARTGAHAWTGTILTGTSGFADLALTGVATDDVVLVGANQALPTGVLLAGQPLLDQVRFTLINTAGPDWTPSGLVLSAVVLRFG